MSLPDVKLDQGIHVMHLFYKINRRRWAALDVEQSPIVKEKLAALLAANAADCQPRMDAFVTVGPRADIAFILYAAELPQLMQMHRDLENTFPAGVLECVYSYLSITELSEYATKEEDVRKNLVENEKMDPESDAFKTRIEDAMKRIKEYEHYRLYPEMQRWEIMCFYPMIKRRSGDDNWFSLDFKDRKRLMGGHARVGRTYAGRVSQLITSSTGLDDWEWAVTLMAHQLDAIRDIVYEMRFDEVSARYGEFGPFYINMRADAASMWEHLKL